jgi:hypothetical protein
VHLFVDGVVDMIVSWLTIEKKMTSNMLVNIQGTTS